MVKKLSISPTGPKIDYTGIPEGEYIVNIISIREDKSMRDWLKMYFLYCEELGNYIGLSKESVHSTYKEYFGIATTKELINAEMWHDYIEKFKFYAFNCCDLIL